MFRVLVKNFYLSEDTDIRVAFISAGANKPNCKRFLLSKSITELLGGPYGM